MDPVACLRSLPQVSYNMCIFCQKRKANEDLRQAGEQGIKQLLNATCSRRKLGDLDNAEIIDRLEEILETEDVKRMVWHRVCYAHYTDKTKIQRLQKKQESASRETSASYSSKPAVGTRRATSRTSLEPVNWNCCIFCQTDKPKESLSSVMTFKMSDQILQAAQLDHVLSVRLAGINDLIAAEAKYHLKCFRSFTRSTSKIQQEYEQTDDADLAMVWLCNELQYAANKGQVIQLNDVWDRYVDLAEESSTVIPNSYYSRRATFKEKLICHIGDVFNFFQPLDKCPSERQTLLIPAKYEHTAVSQLAATSQETDNMLTMPRYEPQQEDIFLSLIHVALKIRSDILAQPGHKGLSVSVEDAMSCVPDSLYMFLRLLYGGQTVLDEGNVELNEEQTRGKVVSVAQDLIYGISGGKKWTPKHIGLASTLHQATRSKDLVRLFNKAGHCLSYEQVQKVDTALAESTLQSMDQETGAVIPHNIVPDKFVHFTADNIDILDETLDGKNTFHATQVAAWQRGPASNVILDNIEPSSTTTLVVPCVLDNLFPANISEGKTSPTFPEPVDSTWFQSSEAISECAKEAQAIDMAFILHRQELEKKPGWTVYNQSISSRNPDITTVGYMPIILAPAHELNTLNTLAKRCLAVSAHLNQEYTVLTVDQALYGKLMELKWAVPEYQDKLIPRLGGLHISMNFLKVIGQHMGACGLAEAWIESGLLGPGAAALALAGKAYNKAMRAHKITFQALWRLLVPSLLFNLAESNKELYDDISAVTTDSSKAAELVLLLKDFRFQIVGADFVDRESQTSVNFSFWWQYMDMITILMMFTRAQRDGIWDLYLDAFSRMVPFFMRYDHYNYARWGPIFIAQMHQLPANIQSEFVKGDFVVKRTAQTFNQVDPDQAQEWLNSTGKKGGGIVGITKTASALQRWTLSYNLRSHIAAKTHEMYNLCPGEKLHNEGTPSRQKRDNDNENALFTTFQRFNVFSDYLPRSLYNIATKDLATDRIQESLLNAEKLGQQQVNVFVQERLIVAESGGKPKISLYDPIKKNNAPTFESLYEIVKYSKEKEKRTVLKADRNILLRLLTAYECGRPVDLASILKHELMPVPVSIAEMNGTLRTGNKAVLADKLTAGIDCPATIELQGRSSCLIIDGQALVVIIGHPSHCVTFGHLADTFLRSVLQIGSSYQRIDVVFDRYREESIKGSTRQRRTRSTRPIRRIIEGRDVPLPRNWSNFLALPDNKADLARFLSAELISNAPDDKEIIVAGGFEDEMEVQSSKIMTALENLRATHEEADTRMVLHAINNASNTVVVYARDTDVLLLLVSHFDRMNRKDVWMMAGTKQKRKYIPIRAVVNKLPVGAAKALLQFHALTGCDTTSYISGHTKVSAWKVFKDNYALLADLGVGELTDKTFKSTEQFICRMYNVSQTDSVDAARHALFFRKGKPEDLPPTSNALRFHIMRVHYQSMVWLESYCAQPELPSPLDMGWERCEHGLKPLLMTLDPIPASCLEIISCSCHTRCSNNRCKCRKSRLLCTCLCGCKYHTDDQTTCLNVG